MLIIIIVMMLIAAVLVYAATKSDTFRIQRSTGIKAPPDKVFVLINDFHNWQKWSPWENMDLEMTRAHSGASAGKGAVYEWEGNKKVGKGRMEIIETSPSSRIMIQLDFIQPFERHNMAEFTLRAERESTSIAWAMYGKSPYIAKLMGLFINFDNLVGKDFETGLSGMKAVAENITA